MKIKYSIVSLLAIIGIFFSSCNDDFMQQDPIDKMGGDGFLKSVGDLNVYLEGLYNDYIEGHREGGLNQGSFGVHDQKAGSALTYGDVFSDNLLYADGLNGRFSGTYDTPQANDKTAWKWEKLRKVNYFLSNYHKVEGATEEEINKLAAEARFFRAMDYYDKLVAYGEVPWIDRNLNIDSEELQWPRTPRVELAANIIADLDFAIKWAKDDANSIGRINKDMARFLKARFCLFEGTFRKYHTELGLTTSADDLFKQAIAAADEIGVMNGSARYELYHNLGIKDSYWTLFTFIQTPQADGNKEAILARAYDGNKIGTDNPRYFQMNNHTRYAMGMTRGFLEEYLCDDGRPIYLSGSEGNYELNPRFKGYDGMWEELENRDPRLKQTVCQIGEYASIYDVDTGVSGLMEAGIVYPGITYNNAGGYPPRQYGTTVSGYRIIKHFIPSLDQRERNAKGTQTALIFRYGELLLIYAEAKEELKQFDQSVADATINKLRERAGFDPKAYLKVGAIVADPRLDAIYSTKLDYSMSAAMREIRRERRVELAVENMRYEDLMRWKAGKLMTVPMRGMKMTKEKIDLYKENYNGHMTPGGYTITAPQAIVGNTVIVDSEGFIIPWPRDANISEGNLPWNDKRYYYPIPINELLLNKNLVQNPGWTDIKR